MGQIKYSGVFPVHILLVIKRFIRRVNEVRRRMIEQEAQRHRRRRRYHCQCRDRQDPSYRHCGCLNCRRRRFSESNVRGGYRAD